MKRPLRPFAKCCSIATAAIALLLPSSVFAKGGGTLKLHTTADAAKVEQAITKAKQFIYDQMKPDGNWEIVPQSKGLGHSYDQLHFGGQTAMAVYALLASGESPQDPRLKKAMEWLRDAELVGTYALGMRCQMYPFLRSMDEKWRKAIKRDYELLVNSLKSEGAGKSMFDYPLKAGAAAAKFAKGGRFDHSVSQYGVLGLWAIAQTNVVEIGLDIWKRMDAAWREHQFGDGSWSYTGTGGQGKGTPTMTAAGIATLFITQDYVNRGLGGECKGNIRDDAIEHGLKWMGDNFGSVTGRFPFYALYGVERIGVASGYKYFGTIDWYVDGANYIVSRQQPDGSWGKGGHTGGVPDAAFCILFLVRGRAPVVMNKLQYDIDRAGDKPALANWNQRPRDLANFTHWFIGQSDNAYLNWQIVNLKVQAADLHDAPILYIAGNQSLNFTKDEVDKLRSYIEQGGMILGNADCASPAFTTSFRKLGSTMFPNYEFKAPPDDHPIYKSPQFSRAKWGTNVPKVLALSNEARLLMVLIPDADISRSWQRGNYGGVEAHHELAGNLFLYATEKRDLRTLRTKGETYMVERDEKVQATRRIKVARLEYSGNWDPEPGGWRRMANIMHNQHQLDIAPEPIKLGSGKLDKTFALAHLTGTGKFTLKESEQAELKKYVADGGTLLVDSCGGGTEFAAAAEAQLAAVFPGSFSTLSVSHPLYSTGNKIEAVGYRAFSKVLRNVRVPQIRGLEQGERASVLFSREDLSVGMVGQLIDGVHGYQAAAVKEKETGKVISYGASEVMANVILYATDKAPKEAIVDAAPAGKSDPKKDEPAKTDPKKDPKNTQKVAPEANPKKK